MKKFLVILIGFLTLQLAATEEVSAQLNKPYFFYRGQQLIVEGNYREAVEMLNMLLQTEKKEYEGYFLRGVAKYNLGDLLGAEVDFTRAIEVNPVYTMAYQYRAITRARLGNYNDALMDYQMTVELRPNMPSAYFSRGVTYFLSQQFEKAVDDFSRYLRSTPKDVTALTNRGTSYLYLKDTTRAYADFNRAIDLDPENADAFVRRGLLAVTQKKNTEGIADLTQAIQIDPEMAVAHFYRAIALVNEGDPIRALGDFDAAIAIDSTNSVAYFNRAILRSQIGDYNRAIQDYDRVALANPGNVLVFYNRAGVKAQIGDYRGAADDYTRAIELYPDFANAYLYRSQMRGMMRDFRGSDSDRQVAESKIQAYRQKLSDSTFSQYADTSRQFDKLMEFDADFGNNELRSLTGDVQNEVRLLPMFRLAVVPKDTTGIYNPRHYRNARLERYLGAMGEEVNWGMTNLTGSAMPEDSLRKWDEVNPSATSWAQNFTKGITQMLLRQYTSALSYYRRALRVEEDNPLVYLNQGVSEAEMIEFIASLEGSKAMQQISVNTGDPSTALRHGDRERQQYDYSEAIADMRKAAELMPELPHAYYNLGNLLCLTGDLPGAYEQYTKAIDLFPFFAEAYYNRGLVQIYLKDTQKGCLDVSKAGELGLEIAYEVLKRYCGKLK